MAGHIESRRNGDGSVSWVCIVTVGYGRGARRVTRVACRSERLQEKPPRKAQELLRAMEREAEFGLVAPQRLRMGELFDRWLDDDVRPRLEAKTTYGYERHVEAHLRPAFGHLRALDVRPANLADYYATKRAAGLSDATIHSHFRTLHRALGWAVRMELLPRNVADAARPPRGKAAEMRTIDAAAMLALVEAARGDVLELWVLMGAATGARWGEVRALRWGDVRLWREGEGWRGSATIAEAEQEVPRHGRFRKGTKTGRARTVPLPPFAVERLRELRTERVRPRDEPLCPPLRAREFSELWRPFIAERHPGLRFHDLRHSFATAALESGAPIKLVQEWLGHTTATTTMNVYAHVTERGRELGADTLAAAFGAPREQHGSSTEGKVRHLHDR